jgi:uncharacterized protein YndB with AHSA1/START domain
MNAQHTRSAEESVPLTPGDTARMAEAGSLIIRKQLDASCEEVFDAWLDPASIMAFMTPGANAQRVDVELDPKVGGKFRIDMVFASDVVSHTGEYLVIDRPRRLSFTWISKYTGNRPSVVTIDLSPHDATRCEIVLTHTGLPENEIPGHTRVWKAMLDFLRKGP